MNVEIGYCYFIRGIYPLQIPRHPVHDRTNRITHRHVEFTSIRLRRTSTRTRVVAKIGREDASCIRIFKERGIDYDPCHKEQ